MPIEFRYDLKKKAIFGTVKSPATIEDFKAAMNAVMTSDQFPPDMRTLWDMRELDFTQIDRNFQTKLVKIRKQFPERGAARLAFIVADDLGFGMSRMFEMLTGDASGRIGVFKSFSEGEEWLMGDQ
jgi:hypothetical protein